MHAATLSYVASLIFLAAIPLSLFGTYSFARMSRGARIAWASFLFLAIALAVARSSLLAVANVRVLQEFDFLSFWINAHVAAAHQNVYDPTFGRALAAPFNVSVAFQRAIVDVGLWYPPPSIFVFLPLAAFADARAAFAFWYVVHAAALLGAIFVLSREFAPKQPAVGLLAIGALTLAQPAIADTVLFGQTAFLLLLAIALFWSAKDRVSGGVWWGLAILIKPFVATLGLALLLRRKLAPITAAIVTVAIATIAAGVLHLASVHAFLQARPESKLPPYVYTELNNTSLLAATLRITHAPLPVGRVPLPWEYLVVAAALVIATTCFCVRLQQKDDEDLALSLCLVLGVILYPVSLSFYSIVLVVPILVLWKHHAIVPYRAYGVMAFALVISLLIHVHSEGTMLAYAVTWLTLALVAARADRASFAARVGRRVGEAA